MERESLKARPDAWQAAAGFCVPGEVTKIERCKEGLIHDTFIVHADSRHHQERFILQRINGNVFPNPTKLMENMERVICHVRAKAAQTGRDPLRAIPELVRAGNGSSWVQCRGSAWRLMSAIEHTMTLDRASDGFQAYEIGLVFGRFLDDLADFPVHTLHEALPGYRDTKRYFAELERAIASDPLRRVQDSREIIAFLQAHENDAMKLQTLALSGMVPIRAIHGDTKINNALIDCESGAGVCVIDLDTVMPGLLLHDVGNCIGEVLVRNAQGRRDLSTEELEMFRAIVAGFMSSQSQPLSPVECANIVNAVCSITLELSVRFLADHLAGDIYFKTTQEGENLARARQLVALQQRVEVSREPLQVCVQRLADGLDFRELSA